MNGFDDVYKTKDLSTAAYLLCKGAVFLRTEPRDQRSLWLVFSQKERSEKLAAEYLTGRGMVSARSFVASINQARDILFSDMEQKAPGRMHPPGA